MRDLKLLPVYEHDMKRQCLALCSITIREGNIWRQKTFICKNHPEVQQLLHSIGLFPENQIPEIQNAPTKSKSKQTSPLAALFKMLVPNTGRESFCSSHCPCSLTEYVFLPLCLQAWYSKGTSMPPLPN